MATRQTFRDKPDLERGAGARVATRAPQSMAHARRMLNDQRTVATVAALGSTRPGEQDTVVCFWGKGGISRSSCLRQGGYRQ